MKKLFAVFAATMMLFSCLSISAYAVQPEKELVSQSVFEYADGSYTVVTVYEMSSNFRSSTKSGGKDAAHYSGGVLQWTFTVYGTFEYNGSSATCTAASYGRNIYVSGWTLSNAGAYRTGASAKATGTMSYTDGRAIYPNVTLTCSGTGVLS